MLYTMGKRTAEEAELDVPPEVEDIWAVLAREMPAMVQGAGYDAYRIAQPSSSSSSSSSLMANPGA